MADITISVIICTYNNSRLLALTLDSLSRQVRLSEFCWEVLVVNNNSTDDTELVLNRYRDQFRTVAEPKQGLTAARRRGVLETTGTWIAFVDDDCLLANDWVDRAVRFAGQNPRCGAFGGRVDLVWEQGAKPLPSRMGWVLARQEHGSLQCEVSHLVGAGVVLRRSALQECGWIERPLLEDRIGKSLLSGGDAEISLRVAQSGWKLCYTPDCRIGHVITKRRTTAPYLCRLARALGVSQILVGALVWEGGMALYATGSLAFTSRKFYQSLRSLLGDVRHGRDKRSSCIELCFSFGTFIGLLRLFRRTHLLGAALQLKRPR